MVGSAEGHSDEELKRSFTEGHEGFMNFRPKTPPPCASRVNSHGFNFWREQKRLGR
jgi:hypothetical protein